GLSGQAGAVAAALCVPAEDVLASHGGLLGQCHGWAALRLYQPGNRPWTGAGSARGRHSVGGAECSHQRRAAAAEGWRSGAATLSGGVRPRGVQPGPDPAQPRFTVVVDREVYRPDLFEELQHRRIAVLSYHRYPKGVWEAAEFRE